MLFQRCTITLKKKKDRSASVRCIADYVRVEREKKRRNNETKKKKRSYTQRERAHRTLCEASHLFNPTSSNKKPTTRKKKATQQENEKRVLFAALNCPFPLFSNTQGHTHTDRHLKNDFLLL